MAMDVCAAPHRDEVRWGIGGLAVGPGKPVVVDPVPGEGRVVHVADEEVIGVRGPDLRERREHAGEWRLGMLVEEFRTLFCKISISYHRPLASM